MLERIISEFAKGTAYAKHLDWLLLKLDTLIARIHEDFCDRNESCTVRTLIDVFSDNRVKEVFGRLACVADTVEYMVNNKSFYKWVRRYWHLVKDAIEKATCSNPPLLETRPSLFKIEREEEDYLRYSDLTTPAISAGVASATTPAPQDHAPSTASSSTTTVETATPVYGVSGSSGGERESDTDDEEKWFVIDAVLAGIVAAILGIFLALP